MEYDKALRLAKISAESDNHMIRKCASKLGNDILPFKVNKYVNQSLLIK